MNKEMLERIESLKEDRDKLVKSIALAKEKQLELLDIITEGSLLLGALNLKIKELEKREQ